MRNRTSGWMQSTLGLLALLAALGLVLAACGGEEANEPEGEGEQNNAAGVQHAQVDLPPFPEAPPDVGNPRLRVPGDPMSYEDFLAFVVTDAAAKWQGTFDEAGIPYSDLNFVPFDQSVSSPCGEGTQEGSPFYCSSNDTIYFPTGWVNPNTGQVMEEYGDFAMAVVAAHEVGHYAQDQLRLLEGQYPYGNIELQADCFAGLWGYSVYESVEEGDAAEAMNISWAGGDLPGTGLDEPGSHGAPEQRVRWFLTGYDSGDGNECLTLTPASKGTTGEETTG